MTRARALSAGRLVRLSEDGDESSGSSGGGSGDGDGAPKGAIRNATLSGASGRHLALELASWMRSRAASDFDDAELEPQNAWEQMELKVKAYYDKPVGGFFRLMYDLLQFSSGRDKLCAFLQNFAKLASSALAKPDSERHWMWRGIEDSMSDGRKIFRFFKEFREVYKMRRGLHRMQLGIQECGLISIATTCGTLDVLAHMSSFVFYLFDNLIWAASVGIVRAKEVPRWQRDMWQGGRRNGAVIIFFGGVALIKRRKNIASFWRIVFAFWANVLLLKKAIEERRAKGFEGPDDARLFHTIELIGMSCSFRDLAARLDYAPMDSQTYIGMLGMVGAAVGLWSNWRKVCHDQCGTKRFVTAPERRALEKRSASKRSPLAAEAE